MWWLIKGSFWFSLVLVLLPFFSAGSSDRLANAPPVEMGDAFAAATGAYTYLSGLCSEKPDVCEKGAKTFTALGYRAREGAFVAYQYLNEKFADEPAGKAAPKLAAAAPSATPSATQSAVEKLASVLAGPAADQAVEGVAYQPMPSMPAGHKPQPYRPPVADKVVTGSLPARVPVPLPRPNPEI